MYGNVTWTLETRQTNKTKNKGFSWETDCAAQRYIVISEKRFRSVSASAFIFKFRMNFCSE